MEKKISGISRRLFIKTGLIGGFISTFSELIRADNLIKRNLTPTEIEGPFYPITPQKDIDSDLTRIEDSKNAAKGNIIFIEGQIMDTDGNPIEKAKIDIWQANAAGRYNHIHDQNKAPIDPNFQGWAVVQSGNNGDFRIKTIFPGTYPVSKKWTRPPHIHFKVSKRGYIELVTQMYFPGQILNKYDHLLMRKTGEEKQLMTAVLINSDPEIYSYKIFLAKA
jgi:protocatechuate 3,4-dioxygenase beta subunit